MHRLKEFILKELKNINDQLVAELNMPRINTLKGYHEAYHKVLEHIRVNEDSRTSYLTEEQCEILANLPTKQIVRVEYKIMTQEEIVKLLNKYGENNEN